MANATEYNLAVSGMKCPNCAGKIERAIQKVPGVTDTSVDLTKKTIRVSLDNVRIGELDLVAAVVNAGYGAKIAS